MSDEFRNISGQIELLEKDQDHLLYLLKGGGKKSRSIGLFALFWNLMLVFFGVFIAFSPGGINQGRAQNSPVVMACLALVFTGVGVGLAWIWLNMRFGKTLLIVNQNLIGLQNELFGRKKIKTLAVGPEDRGALTEAYHEDKRPVYQLEFKNQAGRLRFGVGLPQNEQQELLSQIERFRGGGTPISREEAEAKLNRFDGDEKDARKVLEENQIEISEPMRGELLIRVTPRLSNKKSTGGLLFLFLFTVAWFGFISFWAYHTAKSSYFLAMLSLPFFLVGFVLVGVLLFSLYGTTEISFSRRMLSVRWFCLGLNKGTEVATEEIARFAIVNQETETGAGKDRIPDRTRSSSKLVAQKSNGEQMPIQFATEEWSAALSTYLNAWLERLRSG